MSVSTSHGSDRDSRSGTFVRTVESYGPGGPLSASISAVGSPFEPLLIRTETHAMGETSLRQHQRLATLGMLPHPTPGSSLSMHSSSAAVAAAQRAYSMDSQAELEISYDVNNPNYMVNQHHAGGLNHSLSYAAALGHATRFLPDDGGDYDSTHDSYYSALAGGHGFGHGGGGALCLPSSDSGILLSGADRFVYSVSPLRWWVLSVFVLLSFMQSLIWVTFSPVSEKAEHYYKIDTAQVDLLLNWGPIINLPLIGFVARVASTSRGLQKLVWATAISGVLATGIRLIPVLAGHHMHETYAIYFLHVAQIINAAAGPVMQACVTKLSAIWFAAEERTTSTALLYVSNNLGSAAGFLMAPALVTAPSEMPRFLWAQFGMSCIAFLATFPLWPRAFFPAKPELYPSKAARDMDKSMEDNGVGGAGGLQHLHHVPQGGQSLWRSIRLAAANRSFVFLAVSMGLLQGVTSCWFSVLSTVLTDVSDSTCGWLSFAATMAGVGAGLAMGPLTRHPLLARRLKALVMGSVLLGVLFSVLFMLLTPSVFRTSSPLIPGSSVILLGVAISLLGAFVGAASPLAFELSVELTYPLWESVSGATLAGLNNLGSLLFLVVAPFVSGPVMTFVMLLCVVVCALLLIPVEERYVRMESEEGVAGAGHTSVQADDEVATPSRGSRSMSTSRADSSYHGTVSHSRRRSFIAAQEDAMQIEYERMMRAVDDGMQQPPEGTPSPRYTPVERPTA